MPCSNAANIGEHKTWTQSGFCTGKNSVRWQQPPKNVYIVYQPRRRTNIVQFGWPPVSDVAAVTKVRVKTRKPLKFAGCPKLPNRSQPLVGRSSPYCGGIGLLLFNKFFPDCPSCSCSCHFFSLCQLPTLTIHNSLSFTPSSRPTSSTNLFSGSVSK